MQNGLRMLSKENLRNLDVGSAARTRAASVSQKLAGIRHVALDLDGTIYRGGSLFPATLPFLDQLRDAEIGYTFITNNSSRSVQEYLHHLSAMGISARPSQIVLSTQTAIRHLRTHLPSVRRLFVLGTGSMIEELDGAGFDCDSHDEPDAVVVGFDPEMEYSRLCKAAWWIKQGKPYVATHPDRVCPTDEATVLVDCGAVCAALREATGRLPDAVTGKPEPSMLETVLEAHGLAAHQLAMVGDRLYTDIVMAHRAGALGVLVLSGETIRCEAVAANPQPDIIAEDLAELGSLIAAARTPVCA
jgi:HAD superfamily hydrolase (TIGR01450 family)